MQEILTYCILALTLCYVGWKLFGMFKPEKRNDAGCGSSCGCDAVKLKKEILEKKLLNLPLKDSWNQRIESPVKNK
jgi:hypothetical protein